MTEAVETVAAGEEVEATPKEPLVGKDAIYARLGEFVKELTGKRIGKTGGRKVFDKVVEEIFVEATKEGTFRFNGGYGSMHVKTYSAGSRRLPSGQETVFGERQKLRYEEGVVVQGLVESKGDLAKVTADRKGADSEVAVADPVAAADGEVELV